MAKPRRGEVWLVDLGMKAKTRPCLILSVEPAAADRDLATILAHTTQLTNSSYEVSLPVAFLQEGAFNCQDLYTVARGSKAFLKRLGKLDDTQINLVAAEVGRWLGLP